MIKIFFPRQNLDLSFMSSGVDILDMKSQTADIGSRFLTVDLRDPWLLAY